MSSIAKIKGRYLFGGSQAASVAPQAGSGSLAYTAGAGGASIYASNYVNMKGAAYFSTPFNSTPRNRTIIVAAMMPFWEQVYDTGDATNKFPVVVAPTAPMAINAGIIAWPAGGILTRTGENPLWRAGNDTPDIVTDTYTPLHDAISYRDGSFTIMPQIFVLGHGADGVGVYLGMTCGRKMAWLSDATAYSGSVAASEPTKIGATVSPVQTGSNTHCPILGFAEYSYLTKAEALEAATEMVVLLEARGWAGAFHNPVTSE